MAIDDILDSDVDRLVERTKIRPIPRGAITLERACLFFLAQVSIGLYIAYEFLPAPVSVLFCVPGSLHVKKLNAPTDVTYQCSHGRSIWSTRLAKYVLRINHHS
jgi:hypothetical protein